MITLIGLGPGDALLLSRGAEQALRYASDAMKAGEGALFVRTARHPVVAELQAWGLRFETFDALYETAPDFASVYTGIAERVLAAAAGRRFGAEASAQTAAPLWPVAYAVPGHPLFAEESVRLLRERAAAASIPMQIVSSGSFIDAALTAAGVSFEESLDLRDALTLPAADAVDRHGSPGPRRLDPSRGLLLHQVYDRETASQVKLALMRDYPDEWEVCVVSRAGIPGQQKSVRIPLFRLDREPVDHLTSVYVPPLPAERRRPDFGDLVGVMARLRAPDGCPWDREQSHLSLRRYLIEEVYEVIEAIDSGDPDLLCEELGDLLLQIVFHARLAAEEGVFTIDDVVSNIVKKLVRRHPHVFAGLQVADSEEVLRNWETIKRAEKAEQDPDWRPSALDGVPKGLPALMQAMEISKRAVRVGFEWSDFAGVLEKLDEEIAELKAALEDPDPAALSSELGDVLFTMVQVARWRRIDPEEALRAMLARFASRFRHMERGAGERGRTLSSLTPAELETLWEEAKRQAMTSPPTSAP